MPPKQRSVVEETPEQIEKRKLREVAKKLKQDIKHADNFFNEFQQQRTTLEYFWTTEKKRLDDRKADLRNRHREYIFTFRHTTSHDYIQASGPRGETSI